MATMADVKEVLVERGVTHIVAGVSGGWVHTLCDSLFIGGEPVDMPKKPRVCRECRSKLARATVAEEPQRGER